MSIIGIFMVWMMPLANFLLLLPMTLAVDPDCYYQQSMNIGQSYYIYNKEYPNKYGRNKYCKWEAVSPPNTRIDVNCSDISIPPSNNCQNDRLIIDLTGVDLTNGHNYCGYGSLLLQSEANKISFGLVSTSTSQGGRFLCSIVAHQVAPACDCGWRQQRRIVGGEETGVNEYPFMAALIVMPEPSIWCGSTIISTQHALTAAHCVNRKNYQQLALLVGEHDITTGSDTQATRLYQLAGYKMHPGYDESTYQNDIAIIRVQNLIQFSLNVGPVCLPFLYTTSTFAYQSVTLLGWGTTEFTGPKSDVLLAVNVSTITNADCQRRLPMSNIYPSEICTYTNGKDSCQYDSGGPAIWLDPSSRRYQLIGIISYGNGCGSNEPAVNTRTTSYLSWITQETNYNYCVK